MIRQIIYRYQLLFPTENDASNVFLQFIVVFGLDEALPAFDSKHDVNINLRVGVGHALKMPLMTELENFFVFVLQRCRAYGVAPRIIFVSNPHRNIFPRQKLFHIPHGVGAEMENARGKDGISVAFQ